MKAIVVYYSLEGNTKQTAEKIAANLGAELLEVRPRKAYPTKGAAKFFVGGKSASFSEKPPLEPYEFNADDYDAVIIGTPLWAGKFTPPIRTFLSENDISRKRIGLFICCSGGNPAKGFAALQKEIGCEDVIAELNLVDPLKNKQSDSDIKINDFCDKIKYIPRAEK